MDYRSRGYHQGAVLLPLKSNKELRPISAFSLRFLYAKFSIFWKVYGVERNICPKRK